MPSLSSFMDNGEESGICHLLRYKLPMSMPDITAEEIQAVVQVMQSRNLSIGSQTLEFERLIAARGTGETRSGSNEWNFCFASLYNSRRYWSW